MILVERRLIELEHSGDQPCEFGAQHCSDAISLFEVHRIALGDAISNVCALRACTALRDLENGPAIFARVIEIFCALRRASFDSMTHCDAVTTRMRSLCSMLFWDSLATLNAMMTALCALSVYREHSAHGISATSRTRCRFKAARN